MSLHTLNEVYGGAAQQQTKRYRQAIENFEAIFGEEENLRFFSAPGRSEVCGNHTDHNCGKVMAAGVSLDVIAVVVPTDDNIILVKSEGFEADNVSLDDLSVCEEEKNTSASLIRGVAAGFERNGFKIGGFKAYTTSNVLKGSGLSSSAAFEVLIGSILNGLYNGGAVDDVKIAQIAQFAENEYFGKPSGLMDQMASSVGSFITIDFEDTANPAIEAIDVDFTKYGYSLCIVDTKGSHADLTPEYAAIPKEMKSVAKLFGKTTLREITKTQLLQKIDKVREACGDRAVLRALHFFDDNKRVVKEAQALKDGDINTFLSLVNESGNSSYCYLQNIFACSQPENQGLSLALYTAKSILKGEGACRVHGGGFAGTIQAFVPDSKLDEFTNAMENLFGDGSCYVLSVRGIGGTEVAVDDE
ncbi:MAG: galactokinase [Oscillospiraceae bacterium]|nr:galactokinase [Oscillospiraceae bacterium]